MVRCHGRLVKLLGSLSKADCHLSFLEMTTALGLANVDRMSLAHTPRTKGRRLRPDNSGSNQGMLIGRTALRIYLDNDVTDLAQQIAYNILFAVAPLLIFLTAFSGLVVQQVNEDIANPALPILDWVEEHLPSDAAEFLKGPLESALTTSPQFLLSIGGLLTLWSAKNAMAAVMKGLNGMYGLKDTRSYLKRNAVALALTAGLAASILVSGALQVLGTDLGQDIADSAGLGSVWEETVRLLQWPVTVALVTGVIVLIHRFAPMFHGPLGWYLPGALLTTIGLAVATFGLQIYFAAFGGFSAAYGVFGAVLAFIFWLYVAGIVILAGGIVNATLFAVYRPAKTALADYQEAQVRGRALDEPAGEE